MTGIWKSPGLRFCLTAKMNCKLPASLDFREAEYWLVLVDCHYHQYIISRAFFHFTYTRTWDGLVLTWKIKFICQPMWSVSIANLLVWCPLISIMLHVTCYASLFIFMLNGEDKITWFFDLSSPNKITGPLDFPKLSSHFWITASDDLLFPHTGSRK